MSKHHPKNGQAQGMFHLIHKEGSIAGLHTNFVFRNQVFGLWTAALLNQVRLKKENTVSLDKTGRRSKHQDVPLPVLLCDPLARSNHEERIVV
eukprot:3944568-Pyramimonas_sp.AAC.2